jgi:hypothetical protein
MRPPTFFDRVIRLRSVALLFLIYLLATQVSLTLLYTIVAYLVSAADKTGVEFGNTVNEIAGQYVLLALALGSLLLCVTTWLGDRALYREDIFWTERNRSLWQLNRFTKSEFLRGISSGVLAAVMYLLLSAVSGQIGFLGVYITSTLGTPVFPLFFIDILSLTTLVICEEFLFRHKILKRLLHQMPPTFAVLTTTGLFILVKDLQFELATLDYVNLTLLNLALGYFFLKSGTSHRGIGFLLFLLGILHPIAGLPLWAVESPSFFLFKATARSSTLLSGGAAGPMAGLGLCSILLVFAGGSYLTWKRELEAKRQAARRRV